MLSSKIQPSPVDLRVPQHDLFVPTLAQNTPKVNKKLPQVMFAATQNQTLSRRFAQISPIVHYPQTH
jgi:hypothetical protein